MVHSVLYDAAWRAETAGKPVEPKTGPRVKMLSARIEELWKPQRLKIQILAIPGNLIRHATLGPAES